MDARKLLVLAAHLDAVPRESFDIWTWRPSRCGSECCAVGHACHIPEFAASGLRLVDGVPAFDAIDGDHFGFGAACAFFGLTRSQARHLFDGTRYPRSPGENLPVTPTAVADRIREFVAGRSDE